jgi:hypothetical protein
MPSRRIKSVVCVLVVTGTIPLMASGASAQPLDPLVAGQSMFWGSLGFQGDLSGAVNSSGIGVVNGVRAEINANTWAERYDAAIIFSVGGAYNLTRRSQVFGAMTWEQSEADTTDVGLIGGLSLRGKFSDYQGGASTSATGTSSPPSTRHAFCFRVAGLSPGRGHHPRLVARCVHCVGHSVLRRWLARTSSSRSAGWHLERWRLRPLT